ncbi:lysozyme g-like protein 2 [Ctenodactylus gundi]
MLASHSSTQESKRNRCHATGASLWSGQGVAPRKATTRVDAVEALDEAAHRRPQPPTKLLTPRCFLTLSCALCMSDSFSLSQSPHLHPRLYHGCYGDIMTMETSGVPCSMKNVLNCGIRGSEMFAEMDLRVIRSYQTLIKEIAQRYCIDPAVIAAIISRESHGGVVLQRGWDHRGLKFGLMQLDKQIHIPVGSWDSREHLLQGVGILAEKIKATQIKFPTWNAAQHFKGGLTAFKSGETVATLEDIDVDYVNDVIARARFYKRQGF